MPASFAPGREKDVRMGLIKVSGGGPGAVREGKRGCCLLSELPVPVGAVKVD